MFEYELRRLSNGGVIYRIMVREGDSFIWTPDVPILGKLQWYRRKLDGKRWFKVGEVRDGY